MCTAYDNNLSQVWMRQYGNCRVGSPGTHTPLNNGCIAGLLKQHGGRKCMLGRAAVDISQYVSPLVVNASLVALFHNQHSKTHMYRPYNGDRNDMLTVNRSTSTSAQLSLNYH